MTAQQLKNSILQMAVQGKLVPQDPNDEPASALLERIRAEKERLIKEKKIKREKNPSVIFKGADNTPYEKIGEEVRSLDTPFDIPESWEWIRFKDLVDYSMGKTPPRKETEYWSNGTLPWVSIADLVADGTVTGTKECVNSFAAENTFKGKISKAGTLLMSFKLTVGKVSILGIDAFHNEAIISIYPFVDPDKITTMFLFATLPLLSQSGDTKSAIKGNTLNSDSLDALLIPLPPIMEQKRIIDKLHELTTPLLDYGVAEQKVTDLNANFPEALKKSILQEAVQGKLVPQDPSDELAEALLERIRAEKQRLIKEGKIKKDKHESVIFRRDNSHYEKLDGGEYCIDDELPFEIPESWVWVRFSDIAIFENGDRSSRYPVESDYVPDGIPFFGAKDMGERFMEYSAVRFITPQKYEELGNGKLKDGDFVCLLRGNVGKTRIYKENEKYHTGFICAQMLIIRCIESNIQEFVYTVINSPYYCRSIESKITGTAVRQLPAKEMANTLIPLPPLAEQHRIVQRIVELLPLVKGL
jgi:type I restriction enzyme S subunit